jgi:hypothetical protein
MGPLADTPPARVGSGRVYVLMDVGVLTDVEGSGGTSVPPIRAVALLLLAIPEDEDAAAPAGKGASSERVVLTMA